MNHNLIRYGKYILLAAIVFVPLFVHLETLVVRNWDEARLAQTAYEMLQNGNYLIPHVEGEPDMWSTKPPLLIWVMALSIKFFGVNELAVRLPSALAAIATIGALFVFLKRMTRTQWIGIFSILVLVSSAGYVALHASRTGDYDVPMTLFTTVSCLAYFTFLEKKESWYLHVFFIAITIAVLIKSVNALLFAPALLLYTLVDKKILYVLRCKHFYIGLGYSLLFILGYYFIREHYNPGYLEAVNNNELGGRYFNELENHGKPFFFYLNNLVEYQYSFWIWTLPLGFYFGFKNQGKLYRRFTSFLFFVVISFLLIISSGQTKLAWYVVPIFPFFAIINANVLYYVYEKVKSNSSPKIFHWLTAVVVMGLFCFSYYQVLNRTYCPTEDGNDVSTYYTSYYLKNAVKNNELLNGHSVLNEGYRVHVLFYMSQLNSMGSDIDFVDKKEIKTGDKIISQDENGMNEIRSKFETKTIYNYQGVSIVEIM